MQLVICYAIFSTRRREEITRQVFENRRTSPDQTDEFLHDGESISRAFTLACTRSASRTFISTTFGTTA